MDGIGNAQTGAMTDVMHNVQTGCMDNAQMGAMTKKGTVYFKRCCIVDRRANGRLTDVPGPHIRGRGQLTNSIGQIQVAGRGEKKSQME